MSHTKGEWKAKRNSCYWEVIVVDEYGYWVKGIADVCPTNPHDPDTGEQEANARLISAAPDLLEALEELCECIMETRGNDAAGALQKAKDAITKAKGEKL